MDLIIEKINNVAFQLDHPIRRRKAPHSEVTGVPWRYTRPRDTKDFVSGRNWEYLKKYGKTYWLRKLKRV
jgi:hypothetical protein